MDTIYLEAYKQGGGSIAVSLESLIVLFVYKGASKDKIGLKILLKEIGKTKPVFKLDEFTDSVVRAEEIPEISCFCAWPVITVGNTVVAGLCSVARQIIKSSNDDGLKKLLGFRQACLMACSESSIWTKFCEIDATSTVKRLLTKPENYLNGNSVRIPTNLVRFEYHMEQPVRIHNIYKVAREKNKGRDMGQLDLDHVYSEGPFMTLADFVLYSCFEVIFQVFPTEFLATELPLTVKWYQNMRSQNIPTLEYKLPHIEHLTTENTVVVRTHTAKESLYTSDPSRYKPQNRIYTKQVDVENSLNIISGLSLGKGSEEAPYGHNLLFNWATVPLEANPQGGALPEKRAARKCEQLENLAKAVLQLPGVGNHQIVDFCSGSGHLGILLAALLPQSHVILVENKERSLIRAKERVSRLNLGNVTLLRCNLDYFDAEFDVGVSLHACGVATDLVMRTCVKKRAHFVCCPCCYGGIHDCYHLSYPRSLEFRVNGVSYRDYLVMGHAADQTHGDNNVKTKQGYECMDVVDMDRKLYAEECGYVVYLGKLQPPSCTPKNNLLVGICKSAN